MGEEAKARSEHDYKSAVAGDARYMVKCRRRRHAEQTPLWIMNNMQDMKQHLYIQ